MNKTGKYLFLLLALCLLLALLPVTAFATGTTKVSTWGELQAALSAGGDIVLTGDVTPENPYQADALTVPSGITAALDLNGHRVDRGYGNDTEPGWDGSVLIISGTLTVTDSDPEMRGAITGGFPDQYGGGVQIQGGTFNLLGGSITGNRAGKTGFFGTEGLGGGVYMQSGTFNMSGGSISGNKALGSSMGSSLGRGGGVYIIGGTFNFTGGTISGNTAGSIGGGVYLASTSSGHDGRIKVSGGAITGNTVAGAASNVYLEEGGVLAVTGALTGTIGVTMQTPGVFTDGLSGNGTKENFTSDDAGLVVSLTDAGEAKLGVEEYPLWVSGVQATSLNKGDVLGGGSGVTYDPDTQTLTFPENITLTGAYSDVVIYAKGQDLTIQAPNGLTLNNRDATYGISTGSKALTVETGGVLAITVKDYGIDAGSGGVTVTGNVNITVGEQGIMTDGPVTVTGDVTIRSGGTYGIDARGKVELNGNIDIEANGFCILTYGDIALDYGTCTLTSSSRYDIYGNNITLEGTSLTGVTRSSYDCVSANQKLTLVRGDFSFTGGRRAIQAQGDIEIRSGVTRVYGKCTSTSDSVICAYNNGEIKLADSLRIVTPEDGYIDNTNYSKIVDKNGNNVTEVVIELITYPLWVGGVQVTGANKGDILNDGGTASYDPDSNTLTLNNANITGMYQGHPLNRSIRTEDMDLTVALTGSNTVSGRIALAVYGDLTITGGGSLTATGSASEVIYAKGNLTIDGCTISASAAENYAIFCRGDLAITDSNVTATSEAACAFSSSGGSLTISGDSRLSAQATDSAIKLNNGFDIGEGLGVTTPTDGYVDGNFIKDSDGNTAKSVVIERLSTYSVTVTPGANMTLTSGAASQTVTAGGAMESVVYTADEGYYFPEDYTVDSVNGVAVTRDSFTQITVSGTPTWNAAITLTAPMAKTKPDAPTAAAEDCTTSDNNDGKLTGVTTAMEYKKSDAENWTAGAGSDIENLVPGTYYVRVKATDTTLASDNQELEIKEFISYTVTFKVVNGSWNEGKGDAATADKTVTLTGHDGDTLKLTTDQIPAVGDKPNGTYKAGSWDVTPSAETEITAATTYTYTYAAKETATVTKAPAAKTLTYNGSAQELVTAGTTEGGTMQYALGTATEATQPYTTSIPTETDAGTYYVWYKVVGDVNHNNTEPACVKVTISQPYNPPSPPATITIPVSGDAASVDLTVQVSGTTATVTGADVESVLSAEKVGTVTVDVNSLQGGVNEVVLPNGLLTKIATAVADPSSDADGLAIKLPTGTISFDAAAVAAIAAQAGGKDLKFHLDGISLNTLTSAQQGSVGGLNVMKILDAYMTADGVRISDFQGGSAMVTVSNPLQADQKPAGVVVWFVDVNGEKTETPSQSDGQNTMFTIWHLSNYVIAYDAARAEKPESYAYDTLTDEEKAQADALIAAYGTKEPLDKDTAAQMIKWAQKLNVPSETLLLTDAVLTNLPDDSDPAGSTFGKLTARATKRAKKSLTLQWKKFEQADGYLIYGNLCGNAKKLKLKKDIKGNGTLKWTQKKLKKGKYYKYMVVAYKNVGDKKMTLAASVVVHATTKGAKFTIAKSVKVKPTSVTLEIGQTAKLKASEVKAEKGKKIKRHRPVKYESDNLSVATVADDGTITAVGEGSTVIYVYAQNGLYKTVTVTVTPGQVVPNSVEEPETEADALGIDSLTVPDVDGEEILLDDVTVEDVNESEETEAEIILEDNAMFID